MYEIESKGYWPVGVLNGSWTAAGTATTYNLDGIDYPMTPINGFSRQAYWFTFLAKYAIQSTVGTAVGTDATWAFR